MRRLLHALANSLAGPHQVCQLLEATLPPDSHQTELLELGRAGLNQSLVLVERLQEHLRSDGAVPCDPEPIIDDTSRS